MTSAGQTARINLVQDYSYFGLGFIMGNLRSRSLVFAVAAIIMFVTPLSALAIDRLDRADLELKIGSRVDQVDWNIAGTSPNILSELTWEDLEIIEIIAQGKAVLFNNRVPFGVMIKGRVNYGEILSGDNQDSDFGLDNRTNEFSRSNNSSDEGEVWDLTLGIGPVFKTAKRKLAISPLVGLAYHAQDLTIHDGYQTISQDNPFSSNAADDPPSVGAIAGLASTYETTWRSVWAGVDLELQPTPSLALLGSVEFHSAKFEAEANWNLRSDFEHPISFTHESTEATGVVVGFGARVGSGNLLVSLDLCYQKWQALDGTDQTYLSSGSTSLTSLNEVNWESTSIAAGLTLRF